MEVQHPDIKLTSAERRRLQRILRNPGEEGTALRATIVLLSAKGESAESIARALGVTARAVYKCRQRWRLVGLAGLADAPRSGRPLRITAEYLQALLQTVETDPRELGFAFSRWTRARLAAYLEVRTGVQLSTRWVSELLYCHGWVWRRAKLTTRHLADKEEQRARRAGPSSPPEGGGLARSDLRTVVRGWYPVRSATGHALHVASQGQSAVAENPRQEHPSGRLWSHLLHDREFLFTHRLKSVTTELFLPLLEQLVQRAKNTGRRIVLVLDNGSPFRSKRALAALEAAWPHVRVFWLPRYTSETLNWIEGFWGHLKDTYFSRMLTEEREAFYPDAVRLLKRLRHSKAAGLHMLRVTP